MKSSFGIFCIYQFVLYHVFVFLYQLMFNSILLKIILISIDNIIFKISPLVVGVQNYEKHLGKSYIYKNPLRIMSPILSSIVYLRSYVQAPFLYRRAIFSN